MPRAIVATRAFRRRIPSGVPLAGNLWVWEPLERRRARADLALRWMFFVVAALLVLVAVQYFRGPGPQSAAVEEILWLDTPPEPPPETPRAEPFVPPAPLEATPVPEVPPPLAAPAPEVDPDPDPAFGLDDAGPLGDLVVATGQTLARAAEEVVRPPVEAPAGPVMLSGVPGSTHPVVPRYPPRAEAKGLEATVVALVTTDTTGAVVDFRIEKSGGPEFDESVRRAAMSTRYTVPRRDGRPRAVAFRLPYAFRLE